MTIVTQALDSILRARCEASRGVEPEVLIRMLVNRYLVTEAQAVRAVNFYHRRGGC